MRFCHVNATSAKKHRDEIYARFSEMDIISINETNLHDKLQFNFPGFNIFRYDRLHREGGGVLLAVRTELQCHELLCQEFECNECVAIQLETKGGPILICSLYVPPKARISSRLFDRLVTINSNCLIMGDLNAASVALGSQKTNSKGRQLQTLLSDGIFSCIDDAMTTYERNQYTEMVD